MVQKRRARYIALTGLIVVCLGLYSLTQLNFYHGASFDGFPRLAKVQEALGLHRGNGEEARSYGTVPLIIGHRGSGLKPVGEVGEASEKPIGNTRSAIWAAINAKVDWIEVDFRTVDNEIVLFHDENLDDKTDGTGPVSASSIRNLQTIKVSVNPPEEILTLNAFTEEFLDQLKHHNWVFDIKDKKVNGKKVTDWIEKSGLRPEQVIIFGEYEILSRNFKNCGYRLGYTFTWGTLPNRFLFLFRQSEVINRLRELDAELLVLPVIFTNKDLVNKANKIHVDIWCYGSDNEKDWREVVSLGAKGLIVDNPAKALGFRRKIDPVNTGPNADQGDSGNPTSPLLPNRRTKTYPN